MYLLILLLKSHPYNPQGRPVLLGSDQDVAGAGHDPGPVARPEEQGGGGCPPPRRDLWGHPHPGAAVEGRGGHRDQGQQGPHPPGVRLLGANSGAEESDPGAFQKVQSEGMM